jgi:hypothetical protein
LDFLFLDKAKVFHGPFRELGGDVDSRQCLINTLGNRSPDIVKKAADSRCSHGELLDLCIGVTRMKNCALKK